MPQDWVSTDFYIFDPYCGTGSVVHLSLVRSEARGTAVIGCARQRQQPLLSRHFGRMPGSDCVFPIEDEH